MRRSEVLLRDAQVGDLPEIMRLRTSVRENHLSESDLAARGVTIATIAKSMESGELGAWVVMVGDVIASFAMADRNTGNIFALFTHPDHEGKGFGSKLIEQCEVWLRDNGLIEAILDTGHGTKAEAFYAKRGWMAYRRDAYEVFLRKPL